MGCSDAYFREQVELFFERRDAPRIRDLDCKRPCWMAARSLIQEEAMEMTHLLRETIR